MHCPSSLASLKTASCLSKTAQTWRENRQIAQTWCTFPANRSDMARKSGSMKRSRKTNPGSKAAPQKLCLKSAKNLCLGHRFFDEIRQNPPILWCFQANVTDSLQKSGALSPSLTDRLLFSKRRTSRHAPHQAFFSPLTSRRAPRPTKLPPYLRFLNNI